MKIVIILVLVAIGLFFTFLGIQDGWLSATPVTEFKSETFRLRALLYWVLGILLFIVAFVYYNV